MASYGKDEYTFIWKIKNYLSIYQTKEEHIESPTFQIDDLHVKNWNMWLYPKRNANEDLFIYLMRKRPDKVSESVVFDVKIDTLDLHGNVLKSSEIKKKEMKTSDYHGGYFCNAEELLEQMKGWSKDTLTVRCVMTGCKQQVKPQVVKCESDTVIDIDQRVFRWNVSNTGFFNSSESIHFSCSKMPDFKLNMCTDDYKVNILVEMVNETFSQKSVMFRMTLLSETGVKIASKCDVHLFESKVPWLFPTFISEKDLNFASAMPSVINYTFICECSIAKRSIAWSGIKRYTHSSFDEREAAPEGNHPLPLQRVFQDLYANRKYSDVKLRIGNMELLAHKAVLGTRSPVFSAMFDQDMLENKTGVVDIVEMDEETLKNLLEFMYTDKISEIDYDSALKLLLAADRYQVSSLTEECSSFIRSVLSVENVCQVIEVADLVCQEGLKTFGLKFMHANITDVLNAPYWPEWVAKNVKLAAEVVCRLSEYLKHENTEKSCK